MLEVLKQALDYVDTETTAMLYLKEIVPEELSDLGNKLRQAIADLEKQEPVVIDHSPIYYMRDNHTFKNLSTDMNTALVEIEHEFNAGWIYGMLCSKQEGFPTIHANGDKDRLRFFDECKTALEQAYGIKETK
jgi:hypothetical protein